MEMKNPNTPIDRSVNHRKYSLVSGCSFQEAKVPVKTIFHHVIRAKLYAILTMNAMEGMMLEMDHLVPSDLSNC